MKRCAAILILLLTMSCSGIAPVYVAADRATFDAVAEEYLVYVRNDTTLHPAAVTRRERTVATWNARINAAEGRGK